MRPRATASSRSRLARAGRLRLRALLFVPLSCGLWLCHAFGWGVLGVLAFSAELIRHHDLAEGERGVSKRRLAPLARAASRTQRRSPS